MEKNEKEQTKKYTKTLNFASIILEPSFADNSTPSKTIETALAKAFDAKPMFNLENGIIVEKLNIDASGFFGVLKRNSSINDILTEIRDKKTNSLIEAEDLIFNHYTYFYIDYNSLYVSYIKTKNFQNIEFIISNIFDKATFLNVKVYPIKKSDEQIKSINANCFSMKFSNPEKFVELIDTNKYDAQIDTAEISLKFRNPNPNIASTLHDLIRRNPKDVKKVSVSTDTETTDLVKMIFTREATIELSEDDKANLIRIHKLLQTELSKIVNA